MIVGSPANPTGTMMTAPALAELIRCAEDAGIAVISDEIYHGLDYAFAAESAARPVGRRDHHQFVLQIFLHDRMADRLDGGAAVAGAGGRAAAAEPRDLGADAVADRGRSGLRRRARSWKTIKHGYEENRRILLEGLPRAGLDSFLPVDGAFYLYADVSRFSTDSFDFATRMLEEAGVAATPGVDFDPLHGRNFLRLCYAGSRARYARSGRADRRAG